MAGAGVRGRERESAGVVEGASVMREGVSGDGGGGGGRARKERKQGERVVAYG